MEYNTMKSCLELKLINYKLGAGVTYPLTKAMDMSTTVMDLQGNAMSWQIASNVVM